MSSYVKEVPLLETSPPLEDSQSETEKNERADIQEAKKWKIVAGTFGTAASIGYAIPQVGSPFAMVYGGKQLGAIATAIAGVAEIVSTDYSFSAQLNQIKGGQERRQEEWIQQRNLAAIDIGQIDKQIAAQQIRQAIAKHELETHKKSIEQAKEIEDFLKGKFTNKELYHPHFSQRVRSPSLKALQHLGFTLVEAKDQKRQCVVRSQQDIIIN